MPDQTLIPPGRVNRHHRFRRSAPELALARDEVGDLRIRQYARLPELPTNDYRLLSPQKNSN